MRKPPNTEAEVEYLALRKKARRYLWKGTIFLLICLVIGKLADYFKIPFSDLILESATIAGWVALWRPMEIYLYDLPDARRAAHHSRQTTEK